VVVLVVVLEVALVVVLVVALVVAMATQVDLSLWVLLVEKVSQGLPVTALLFHRLLGLAK
tara:strand:- start:305 stop:484 length:180 start_codon:yes stop_codon:yes gene_type:complete